jgi:Flp pilus assembly protein TadB
MSPDQVAGAAALAGVALLVVLPARPGRRPSRRRLAGLGRGGAPPRVAGTSPVAAVWRGGSGGRRPLGLDRTRLVAALAGLTAGTLIGGWPAVPVGLVTTILFDRLLRRLEPAAIRRRRLREAEDLPLAADLLAAALRAGAPVDRAVCVVAEALGGPLGERLIQVGRTLRLGGDPGEAWGSLAGVAGAERLTRAALRSAASGAALAGALTRLADDLRADRVIAAEAAARRAGVLMVLPLGLCFLPAFVLAGLVPVVVAVLDDVL